MEQGVRDRTRTDVLIVGAGLMGTALAFHLARQGIRDVVVVNRDPPLAAATGRSAGILTYAGWDRWDLRLVRESAEEYRTISDRWGRGNYRENGGVRVVRTEEGVRWLERVSESLRKEEIPMSDLDSAGVGKHLRSVELEHVRRGLFLPGDAIVDSPDMARAYSELATREGVRFVAAAGEPHIAHETDHWAFRSADWEVTAPRMVLACGAWTKKILEGLDCPLPLAPFRTQACLLRPSPLMPSFPTLHDTDLGFYLRPAAQGRILVGDGTSAHEVDPDQVNLQADASFVDRIHSEVSSVLPDFDLHVESAWAGTCVASPDPFPLVGKVPGRQGLFVATGFNGFGTMRAAALARRLAEGMVNDNWEPLRPADPGRFPPRPEPFLPRPEFSIRDDGSSREDGVPVPSPGVRSALALEDPPIHYRSLVSTEEVDALRLSRLSVWFEPFLPHFLRDALRSGGRVEVAEDGKEVRGVYLFSPAEKTGSLFTRVRSVAEHFYALPDRGEFYSERAWWPGGGLLHILLADLRDWKQERPLRHPVQVAGKEDIPRVQALVQETAGSVDEEWFRTLPRPEEVGFLSEVNGRVVGVSWLSLAGSMGRGHSLVVHPRYRALGIGADLLVARNLWLQSQGFEQVVSEIYETNPAPLTAAVRAGMAPVGQMWVYHRP